MSNNRWRQVAKVTKQRELHKMRVRRHLLALKEELAKGLASVEFVPVPVYGDTAPDSKSIKLAIVDPEDTNKLLIVGSIEKSRIQGDDHHAE